ncbi:MAG: hypothetical protein C4325_10600, partial [Blastocatellia bacterium]
MKKRVCPRSYTNSISGRKEYIWLYVMITLIAAAILAFGFFLAARQHFSAMELSFRNSAMRQQLSDLEAEQRRLLLVREVARSPAEIKRAAARLGFRRAVPAIELAADRKTAANSGTSVIAKTAMTRPVVISDSMRSAKSKTVKAQTSSGAGEVTAGNPAGRS